jgi:aryl-alcohol dehydrogenase-like predicted oxidoreductase
VYSQGALLKRGGLTTDEALGYALSLERVSTAIIGCSTTAEVDENARISCRFVPRDDQQMRALEAKAAARAIDYTAYKKPLLTSLR